LHYAYPAQFPYDILRVMRERDNVCKYLDIALQHISDNMLTIMRRKITKEQTYELIKRIRDEVPGIHLRTTMIIGHPGETEQDMEELKEFLTFAKFERLGTFTYSHEEGTHAYEAYKDTIPEEVKQERFNEIMALQQGISGTINQAKIGKKLKVMVDRVEGENFVGRTEFDSPEVDPEVLIPVSTEGVKIGEFYLAEIIDTTDFDLYAK
jgi:ribosomal protein S12 methylthiotransferase